MGQLEVFKFLEDQRKVNDRWFKVNDIKAALSKAGFTNGYLLGIHSDLLRLSNFNIIEMRGLGIWDHHKEFRAFKDLYKRG